jgi:WD40 repeat protein
MGRYAADGFDLPTVLTGAKFDDADLFNYRFPGLKGYYCFWDLEPALDRRYMLLAGSRGQLLLFDLASSDWGPIYLETQHEDDIIDMSRHPTEDVIVTTGRDGSVRLYKLPEGLPQDWPRRLNQEGLSIHPIPEICRATGIFKSEAYPRRSQFSASGRWLTVISRDFRVVFLPVPQNVMSGGGFGKHISGLAHTGPVMCVIADLKSAGKSFDRFYTAGYDGRIVMWRESSHPDMQEVWKATATEPVKDSRGEREIIRALAAPTSGKGALWAGSETECKLRLYRLQRNRLEEDPAAGTKFQSGVFSLAIDDHRNLMAVGLASGDVFVFKGAGDSFHWTEDFWHCRTGDEIVRSIRFVDEGRGLLAATWDGILHQLDLNGPAGEIVPARSFVYPETLWRPQEDLVNFDIRGSIDLTTCGGVSRRMRAYLQRVGEAGLLGANRGK